MAAIRRMRRFSSSAIEWLGILPVASPVGTRTRGRLLRSLAALKRPVTGQELLEDSLDEGGQPPRVLGT